MCVHLHRMQHYLLSGPPSQSCFRVRDPSVYFLLAVSQPSSLSHVHKPTPTPTNTAAFRQTMGGFFLLFHAKSHTAATTVSLFEVLVSWVLQCVYLTHMTRRRGSFAAMFFCTNSTCKNVFSVCAPGVFWGDFLTNVNSLSIVVLLKRNRALFRWHSRDKWQFTICIPLEVFLMCDFVNPSEHLN